MVFFNHATRQMTAKIVYYGPGLCGKTTNLNTIYARTSQKARGEMVSLNTETDRTLFFDLLPMDVGVVGGFKAKLQLYTVPGQVFYNSTRKLVLKGVDGIVFVADSQVAMLDANRESLQNLSDNLKELGLSLGDIPMVFQWNKRDLKNIVALETLEAELNPRSLTSFQTIASDGTGVFETLRGITKLALAQIKALHLADSAVVKEPLRARVPEPEPEPAPAPEPVRELIPEPIPEPVPAVEPEPLQAFEVRLSESMGGEPAPLPEALSFLDLPSAKDLFGTGETPAPPPSPQPAPALRTRSTVQVMAPLMVKLHPLQAKNAAPAPGLLGAPPRLKASPLKPLAPLAPRPLAPPMKAGHLAHPGALAPRVTPALVLALPAGTADGELEVTIQVRQKGRLLVETTTPRVAPAKGAMVALALEIKRS